MDKNIIKKILLYISLIPYIILFVLCIYWAVFGYYDSIRNDKIYGLYAMLENLGSFYFDNMFPLTFIGSIYIVCFIYIIWFFVNRFTTKKNKLKKQENMDIAKVLFVLSCSVWILYFLSGVYAMFVGYTSCFITCHDTIYGFEAMKEMLFINLLKYSLIPVLPISLIYMIIYLFKKKK